MTIRGNGATWFASQFWLSRRSNLSGNCCGLARAISRRDCPEDFLRENQTAIHFSGSCYSAPYSAALSLTLAPARTLPSVFTSLSASAQILQGLASRVSSSLEIG